MSKKDNLIQMINDFLKEHEVDVIGEFGSWEEAFDYVGINIIQRNKYTKNQVIAKLQRYLIENPTITVSEYVKEKRTPHYTTIIKLFGSWEEALKECGIECNHSISRTYTDEEILDSIRIFFNKYGEKASFNKYKELKIKPSTTTITSRFGTWNKAIEAACIKVKTRAVNKMSDTELLEVLKEAKMNINGKFNIVSYEIWAKENSKAHPRTIRNRFETWNNALEKAGLK